MNEEFKSKVPPELDAAIDAVIAYRSSKRKCARSSHCGVVGRKAPCFFGAGAAVGRGSAVRAFMIALAVIVPSCAGADPRDGMERFALSNECLAVDFIVDLKGGRGLGLTEAGISAAAESRLRAARLYDGDAPDYLYANVLALSANPEGGGRRLGYAVNVSLEFKRRLCWEEDRSFCSWGQVRNRTGLLLTGRDGTGRAYVMEDIREKVEEFLADYLRVNEEACKVDAQ